ncbi:MAG: thioesterase family protein [Myxococcota bacterium]
MSFTSIQRIRFDDVDGAGIVYYPRFFHLCHAAFEDFFNAEGPYSYPELIGKRRMGFPTVHLESDFRFPLKYGDSARVTLAVEKVGHKSATFRYTIHRDEGGELSFECRIVTALMDLNTGKSVAIEGELRSLLLRHQAESSHS